MGFESFMTKLGGGPATHAQVVETVRRLPHVRPDAGMLPSSLYFAVADGRHVIEIEIDDKPVRVSLRFTLCHPPSGLYALLALVRRLMTELGMNVVFLEGAGRAIEYTLADFDRYAEESRHVYPHRRAEWVTMFGPEEAGVSTTEAFARFILPACVPAAPAASTGPAARPPAAPAR